MTEDVRRADREGWIDRQARREVDFSAFVHRPDGSRTRAQVINLSYDGCEIDGVAMAVGDAVKLDLTGLGQVEAEIRWVIGDKSGAQFVDR